MITDAERDALKAIHEIIPAGGRRRNAEFVFLILHRLNLTGQNQVWAVPLAAEVARASEELFGLNRYKDEVQAEG